MIPFYRIIPGGVVVKVKAQPGGAMNRIEGVVEGAPGEAYLKVKVTCVAEKGKANNAIMELLSKEWDVAVSDITLLSGSTAKLKQFEIRALSESELLGLVR
ncbi:MAG: DUF167 domain-containing protein [Proteobacteria bacterium]|nr:DUF167 domain-containing protein [Pseudomonadota bacterium]